MSTGMEMGLILERGRGGEERGGGGVKAGGFL